MLVFWAMVNVHTDVLIGGLCNKTANSFNIPELWFLIGLEDGYKIAETCRPVNNFILPFL